MPSAAPVPLKITVHTRSKTVDLHYPSEQSDTHLFNLSAEYLRVHSPSAEVQKHGNPETQEGKKEVTVTKASPVGLYGIKFHFDDGHNTGIYTWPYLHELCSQYEEKWMQYLDALHKAGKTREKQASVVKFIK